MSRPTHPDLQSPRISIQIHIGPTLLTTLLSHSHTHQVHGSSTPLLTITSSASVNINVVLVNEIVSTRLESRDERCEIVLDRSVESDGNVGREEQDVEEWGDEEYNALFAWLRQAREERQSGNDPDFDDVDGKYDNDEYGYEGHGKYEIDDNHERRVPYKPTTKRRDSLNLEPALNTKSLAQEFDALELDADDQALVEEWRRLVVEESEKSMSLAAELDELDLDRGDWDLVRMWRGDGSFEVGDDEVVEVENEEEDGEEDEIIGYYEGW
jgi:hypothetical protein